jgi:YidC/Oxa1 family membrane protein insertase
VASIDLNCLILKAEEALLEDKRLLIAALLSLAVLIGWQMAFPPPEPPEAPAAPIFEGERMEPEPERELEGTSRPFGEAETLASDEPASDEPEAEAPGAEDPDSEIQDGVEASYEEEIVVEVNGSRATFSNRGAQLISYQLLEHDSADGGPVDLVRNREEGPYLFSLTGANDRPSPLNERLFVVERSRDELGQEWVAFTYSGPDGEAEKIFLFRADGLMEVSISVRGDDRWGLRVGPGIRNPSEQELENRFARRSGVFKLADDVDQIDSQGAEEAALIPGRGLTWIGLQDVYFLIAMIPDEPTESAVFLPTVVEQTDGTNRFTRLAGEPSEAQEDLTREMDLVVYPGAETFRASTYLGAKYYSELKDIGVSLEKTISLGVFSFLAKPLLWALLWIHDNLVANYGWAIVLLTILVRIVLFPLTHKGTVSMKKMQALNPQIQAIRQKYRGKLKDKKGRPNAEAQRRMNEEIMGLYKSEGVNPAGGCLPILLQMPVLFAFYSLLSATVELRHAPWILWIQDLSAPDPFYVLPIVMGATQFLQQKMMPATGDPSQRRIMMLMPAFFTILFLKFASGLVLYWLTSNVVTIIQQVITNRLMDKKEAGSSPRKKKGSKG